ncbi:DUF4296 domain-containing protein [Flavobacterium sp.]
MNKSIIIICCALFFMNCNNGSVAKPDNLIERDKMTDILYDISLLEAIKAQNINGGLSSKTSSDYIYKKYKIDSVQFVKSNKYYASDIAEYKKMVEEVKERIARETAKIEDKMKKNGQQVPVTTPTPPNQDVPQIQ